MWVLDWGHLWKGCVLMEIVIYGEPIPQGRPRFANGHAYEPQRSKNYKLLVRFWVTQYLKKIPGWKPFENALCVDLTFYMGIPSSWAKQKRIGAIQGQIRPTSKRFGDLDNMVKCVTDAISGLVYVDDSQIVNLGASKYYSDTPRCVLKVIELENK